MKDELSIEISKEVLDKNKDINKDKILKNMSYYRKRNNFVMLIKITNM